jgi:DNA-binding PadR family transcriptional regulator
MRFGHGELHLVLLALLSERPMHGYDLMAELSKRLGRRYRASPGSIYPAIQALENEGLLAVTDDGDRRVYEPTPAGRAALAQRRGRLVAVEERLGVRFAGGVEAAIGRFSERVRAAARDLDAGVLERLLDEAAHRIEDQTNDGGRA